MNLNFGRWKINTINHIYVEPRFRWKCFKAELKGETRVEWQCEFDGSCIDIEVRVVVSLFFSSSRLHKYNMQTYLSLYTCHLPTHKPKYINKTGSWTKLNLSNQNNFELEIVLICRKIHLQRLKDWLKITKKHRIV